MCWWCCIIQNEGWNETLRQLLLLFLILPSFLELLPECYSYGYLDDFTRAQSFYDGYYGCDDNLQFGWYRFGGAAGSQMASSCVAEYRCRTHAPGWLSTPHPSENDGIVSGTVCFNWVGNCCLWSTNIRIRNCGRFYVYELRPPTAGCHLRYCGNGGGMVHFLQWTGKKWPMWQAQTRGGCGGEQLKGKGKS